MLLYDPERYLELCLKIKTILSKIPKHTAKIFNTTSKACESFWVMFWQKTSLHSGSII